MFNAEKDNFYYTYNMSDNGKYTTSFNTYLFKLDRNTGLFHMALASHKYNSSNINHKIGRNIARMRIEAVPFIFPLELTYDLLKNNEYRLNSIDLYYCLLETEYDHAKRMKIYEKYIEYCETKSPDEIIKISPYFCNNLIFKNGNSEFWDFVHYFNEKFDNWKDYLTFTYKENKEKAEKILNDDFNCCYLVITECQRKQQEKLQNKQFRKSRKNVKTENI